MDGEGEEGREIEVKRMRKKEDELLENSPSQHLSFFWKKCSFIISQL